MPNMRISGVIPSKSTLAGDIRPLVRGAFASTSLLSGSLRGTTNDLEASTSSNTTLSAILKGIFRPIAGGSVPVAGLAATCRSTAPIVGVVSPHTLLFATYSVETDSLIGSLGSTFNVTAAELNVGIVHYVFLHFGSYIEKIGLRASARFDVRIVSTQSSNVSAGRQYEASFCKINPEVYPWFYR